MKESALLRGRGGAKNVRFLCWSPMIKPNSALLLSVFAYFHERPWCGMCAALYVQW
jgi:hypothetical protein